jgi:hypothetical protein
MDEDQKPTDPISENQNLLKNKPVKAFLAQDHAAHIAVHMSMAQDPKIQALVKNVPQLAQQLEATLMAHVFDHLGMQYRGEIEKQLGMTLPPQHDENGEDINMPPDVEARLSPLLAQAAAQLVQQNSAQAAQQQAQQQAQDPIIQMQMQELQIKAQEQQRKSQRDMADIQLEQQRLGLERERIQMQVQTDMAKTMASTQKEKEQMAIDMMKYQKDKEHDSLKQDKQLLAQGLQQAHQFADAEENRKHQSEISKQKFEKPEVKEKKGK